MRKTEPSPLTAQEADEIHRLCDLALLDRHPPEYAPIYAYAAHPDEGRSSSVLLVGMRCVGHVEEAVFEAWAQHCVETLAAIVGANLVATNEPC